jgi:hypothetical protein
MTNADQHDHRPGTADQRAALATWRAILLADEPAAHDAAARGTCPACTVIAAASFGIAAAEQLASGLTAKLAPGAVLDAGPFRAAILATIAETERELRAAGN